MVLLSLRFGGFRALFFSSGLRGGGCRVEGVGFRVWLFCL